MLGDKDNQIKFLNLNCRIFRVKAQIRFRFNNQDQEEKQTIRTLVLMEVQNLILYNLLSWTHVGGLMSVCRNS